MITEKSSPEQGGAGPFRYEIDRFVELGLLECTLEANHSRREGTEEGLKLCLALHDETVEEVESILVTMQELCVSTREMLGAREATHDEYLRQVAATAALGGCFEMLRAAHRIKYGEFYSDPFIIQDGEARSNYSFGISELGVTKLVEITAE